MWYIISFHHVQLLSEPKNWLFGLFFLYTYHQIVADTNLSFCHEVFRLEWQSDD